MKYLVGFLSLVLLQTFLCFGQGDRNFGIIPAPKSILKTSGYFKLDAQTVIFLEGEENRKIVNLFKSHIKDNTGLDIRIVSIAPTVLRNVISFSSAQAQTYSDEAYILSISPSQIIVKGKQKGLFYAVQTLIQLVNQYNAMLPAIDVDDEPRYTYRGLHLDVSRHFYPVSFIKQYLDLMAKYKLNNFHWHLTDDQGWRIEIKKYPKLTQVGGFRAQTIIGNFHDRMPQWFDGVPYGGFYTQQEIREIVAYADAKFINVIPEIDMPGHSVAALAAYPNLACNNNPGPFKTYEKWGISENVFCAGKDSTFYFLENVLTEVMQLFPSKYIHIGGDEVPKTQWKSCPYCQKRIRNEKLNSVNELQSYFIKRIEKFINKNGRTIIGWDEILEGGLAPNATVMSWQNVQAGISAARQKHNVIMAPSTMGLYLDHTQGRSDQEPVSIGGDGRMQKIYAYNPTPEVLNVDERKYILGVQANVWTEYMPTIKKVEYMLMPRILAVSEIAWTALENKSFPNFMEERAPLHLAWFDKTDMNYRVPTAIGAKDTTINVNGYYFFDWKPSVKGAKIYYSIDDYKPSQTTLQYTQLLKIIVPLGEQRPVKSIVITPSGKQSAVTTTWLKNRIPFAAVVETTDFQPGLKFYYVPGNFKYTTEIDTSAATLKGLASTVSINKIPNKVRQYGLIFDGYIYVNDDANYEFSLYSDDGSKLYIDDELLIDNDLKHARFEISAGADLKRGYHKFKVAYFDGGPGSTLQVFIKGTDGKKIELPSVMLFH